MAEIRIIRDPEDIVTLFAAKDESGKPLKVHKDVACHYSPVFKAAFNSKFTEGETQTYKLEDVGQRTVRLLIHVSSLPDLLPFPLLPTVTSYTHVP